MERQRRPVTTCENCKANSIQEQITDLVKRNGIMCPICMLSLLGPRPVYKKNGFPCSYRSRILSNSLSALASTYCKGYHLNCITLAYARKTSPASTMDAAYAQSTFRTAPAVLYPLYASQTGQLTCRNRSQAASRPRISSLVHPTA